MESIESKALLPVDDSQINPATSTCLEENVAGFQQCAKEILKLIEQDGNFSEMTAEIYDDKKSKLSTHVAELSRMHGVLVDQHVQLIGEFSKNSQSLIKKQHLDASDSSSPQITQMFTPDQMSNTQKFRTPIGFDVLSSCGGGSYASRREGSESSFSLSSDSDSESFISTNKLLISPINGGDDSLKVKDTKQTTVLLQKISTLEDELVTLNTKLQTLSDENTNLKQKIQENESDIKTQNSHFETEKMKGTELEKQVADLKLVISDSNLQIKTIGNELDASRNKLLAAEGEISKQMHELDSEKENNLGLQKEVSIYVADISVRDDQLTELNTKIDQSMQEISLLKTTHKADIERLQMEIMEKCQSVDELNKNLDGLKLKKDGVTAQLDTLRAAKCCQDNLVRELETRLSSLQLEHERVLLSFENAEKVTKELKLKVVELESEVDMQREVMSVRAEEKREAIRQLSFSLEHYMSGYKQLRHAFVVGNRRRAVFTF